MAKRNRQEADVEVTEIDGLPGYGVSRDGRAWSKRKSGKAVGQMYDKWLLLKGRPAGQYGYLAIAPKMCGVHLYKYIHLLVLRTFVGPPPSPAHQARHKDGNNLNNALCNLEWGTPTENSMDKIEHGTSGKGEANSRSKLSSQEATEIRRRFMLGENRKQIASDFGITRSHVTDIGKGRRWAHL